MAHAKGGEEAVWLHSFRTVLSDLRLTVPPHVLQHQDAAQCICITFSSVGVHMLDGSKTRALHLPLRLRHHCVPVGALHLPWIHATDITDQQETGTPTTALLCSSCRGLVSCYDSVP